MVERFKVVVLLPALLVAAVSFASVFGTVKVIVHDPQHRPVKGAEVIVQSRTSDLKQTGTTDDEGVATILNVSVGEYEVIVNSQGFASAQQGALVSSDRVQELHFALNVAAHQETVEVYGTGELVNPSSTTPQTTVTRADIVTTPGADQTNSLKSITDFTPGAVVVHDQLHVRGGHQVSWVIDGVNVPNTNIASNVGPQFDPKNVDYVEEQRGGYSAEYGDRSYGVFNVATRTGFEGSRQGELVASYGSLNTTDNQLSFADHNDRSAYFVSIDGNRTDYGLSAPTSAILHDLGSGGGLFTSLISNVTPNDQLRFVGAARADFYQVPNDQASQALGIRDREHEHDVFGSFSWIHSISPGVALLVAPSYHFNRAAFEGLGDPQDRLVTSNDRASSYLGGQVSLSVVKGRHNAKIGFYGFGQRDDTLFGLFGDNLGTQVNFPATRQKVNGDLEAAFVEEQFKAAQWLTVNGGLRFTRFSGLVTENVVDPRAGVAIQIPRLKWVVRGSYSRFYQAPPFDTVSNSLQQTVLNPNGLGFLPLRGERDEQHEIGIVIPIRNWVVEVDNFRTGAHNYFDHDAIANSNLFFPLTIQAVRIRGTEVTARAPKLFKRVDLHVAYSHQSAEGSGAVTGGLSNFSPSAAGFFFLDHDQRDTLSVVCSATLPWKSWISGTAQYGSGFLNGDGPAHLPAYATFDLAVGRSFRENWSLKLTGTNLSDSHYFVDLSNTFGGSHFSAPRMISVQLRYRFHY